MNVEVLKDNIADVEADVVVSPGNSLLTPGGGVSKNIFDSAGEGFKEEAEKVQKENFPEGLSIGDIAVTKGHGLPAKYVFHKVGPVYGRDELEGIWKCYWNAFEEAERLELNSIALPGISLGVFGVPPDVVAEYAEDVLNRFEFKNIEKVIFVLRKEKNYNTFKRRFD